MCFFRGYEEKVAWLFCFCKEEILGSEEGGSERWGWEENSGFLFVREG